MQRNVEPEALGLFSVLLQVHSYLPKGCKIVVLERWTQLHFAPSSAIRLPESPAIVSRRRALENKGRITKPLGITALRGGVKCQSIDHLPAYWHQPESSRARKTQLPEKR